jgi:hypothetical protein
MIVKQLPNLPKGVAEIESGLIILASLAEYGGGLTTPNAIRCSFAISSSKLDHPFNFFFFFKKKYIFKIFFIIFIIFFFFKKRNTTRVFVTVDQI